VGWNNDNTSHSFDTVFNNGREQPGLEQGTAGIFAGFNIPVKCYDNTLKWRLCNAPFTVIYCDMSIHCWVAQPASKQDFRAGAMTSHFRSKGMSRVFTWLPGDEPPSCQTATGVGDMT
jgi:hypothetical protein